MRYLLVLLIMAAAATSQEGPRVLNRSDDYLMGIIEEASDTAYILQDSYVTAGTLVLRDLHGLCIWFQPGTEIILDDTYSNVIQLMDCSDITILNGSFRHVDPLDYYDCQGSVFRLMNSSDITLDNCTISGCGAMGVVIEDCSDVTVTHCLIQDNSFTAFYLWAFDGLRIVGCEIVDNGRLFYSTGQQYQTNLEMNNNLIMNNVEPGWGDMLPPGLRDK